MLLHLNDVMFFEIERIDDSIHQSIQKEICQIIPGPYFGSHIDLNS